MSYTVYLIAQEKMIDFLSLVTVSYFNVTKIYPFIEKITLLLDTVYSAIPSQ